MGELRGALYRKAARRRLFNSTPLIGDQAASALRRETALPALGGVGFVLPNQLAMTSGQSKLGSLRQTACALGSFCQNGFLT
jgi:hypothetical protein